MGLGRELSREASIFAGRLHCVVHSRQGNSGLEKGGCYECGFGSGYEYEYAWDDDMGL